MDHLSSNRQATTQQCLAGLATFVTGPDRLKGEGLTSTLQHQRDPSPNSTLVRHLAPHEPAGAVADAQSTAARFELAVC